MDDLINEVTTNGKSEALVYQKSTAGLAGAGAWSCLGNAAGSIPASTYGAADLTFTATDDTWSEGTLYHGGNKSPDTKHFISAGASAFNATGAPWILMCVDQVGYVKLSTTNVSTIGAKVVTMTPIGSSGATVDRYPNGEGLRMYMSASGALGANAPTCIINYLDTGGAAGATTTFTSTASATTGSIINTGAAVNKYGPFIPLAAGDTGVSNIVNVTWAGTAHASGTVILHLVKPLFTIPLPANGIHTMLDFVNSIPSLRKIPDGANLRFILFNTAATPVASPVFVELNVAWG